MKIEDATDKAFRILEEEQIHPTVDYDFAPENRLLHVQALLESLATSPRVSARPGFNLFEQRKLRPRPVQKSPRYWEFRSDNYKLLLAIYEQVHEDDRSEFISRLTELISTNRCWRQGNSSRFPNFAGSTSCLALLAEFCIRTGHVAAVFDALSIPQLPTPGIAILLMQFEEVISLNFDLFSDSELAEIPSRLAQLREVARLQTFETVRARGSTVTKRNPNYKSGYKSCGRAIVDIIDGLIEECRQARMYYLKLELARRTNVEIESDRGKIEGFLTKLGFNADMIGALNAAEDEYRTATTKFDLKNCFGHLRSFLEHLHLESAKALSNATGETPAEKWSLATVYLRKKSVISLQHEQFATSLYALISDTSIHPLGAKAEYARLLRNVVIEYGVMFLGSLDEKGIKITSAPAQSTMEVPP